MTDDTTKPDDSVDAEADAQIKSYVGIKNPTSFFLFAGAGSGKTRSLVEALDYMRTSLGRTLRLTGKNIGVITYTNNACDEIKRRLDFDPTISVSTIHSFVWDLIQGFNADIRTWLHSTLRAEIEQIREEERKGRPGTKASIERLKSIESIQSRLALLPTIKRFIYSPTGDNRTRDSLNHSEVIKIGASFITSKPAMQRLLIHKFPILLIDESQDTAKLLIDAFFSTQANNQKSFCLGLFGDTMQRIYADGKTDLGQNLPGDWKAPAKIMNHRCPKRVVRLINKIRQDADGIEQKARSDASEGWVRLFISASETPDKQRIESAACAKMAELTGDSEWNNADAVKFLILEHLMAAKRLGFLEMFEHLSGVASFQTGLRDGSLPVVRIFSESIYPLVSAKQVNNQFAATTIVRNESPLLTREAFAKSGADQLKQVRVAKEAVDSLMTLFAEGKDPTFLEVIQCVADSRLFDIPVGLLAFVSKSEATTPEESQEQSLAETVSKSLEATRNFLGTKFSQIAPYRSYVRGASRFSTHQGVKGLEFPRVLVIMDDAEAGGFLFSYEKLFGAKEKTPTDLKNEMEGKETGIDRTRRLFYVTCSRAKQSLAIIAYTTDSVKVRKQVVEKSWFEESEIISLA
jgi:DNA helicase-2/ATP-dependent DNA helicase PcrA